MSLEALEPGVLYLLLKHVHDVPTMCRCSCVCKDWKVALDSRSGSHADLWLHLYKTIWKESPEMSTTEWDTREEAIRVHCLASHFSQNQEMREVDLTVRSAGKAALFHVESLCSALGGALVVAAGSGRVPSVRGCDVALAVVLKAADGQKLGTLLHAEDRDCIDSVCEVAYGHVATSVCSRDLVGFGSDIKIWDLRGESFSVVQVIPSGGSYGWASVAASGLWLAAACYDGSVDVFKIAQHNNGEERMHASWQRRIDAATEAGSFEVAPRTCFLASDDDEGRRGHVIVAVCPLPREMNRGQLWDARNGALLDSFELKRTRMVRGVASTAGLIVTWTEDDVQVLDLGVEGPLKRIDDGRMVGKGSQVLCCAVLGGKLVMLEQKTQPLLPDWVSEGWYRCGRAGESSDAFVHFLDVHRCSVSRGAPRLGRVACPPNALLFPGATLCLGRGHIVFACGRYVNEDGEGAEDAQESPFLLKILPFVPPAALR